jgi:hypothetical protein
MISLTERNFKKEQARLTRPITQFRQKFFFYNNVNGDADLDKKVAKYKTLALKGNFAPKPTIGLVSRACSIIKDYNIIPIFNNILLPMILN